MSDATTDGFDIEWVLGGEPEQLPPADVVSAMHAQAAHVRLRAGAFSSGFKVGATLLTATGEIVTGCNIEASNGTSVCAERVALGKAFSEGHTDFVAVCSIGDTEAPITPCGQCRQHLADLAPTMLVLMATTRNRRLDVVRLDRLFPRSNFGTGTSAVRSAGECADQRVLVTEGTAEQTASAIALPGPLDAAHTTGAVPPVDGGQTTAI